MDVQQQILSKNAQGIQDLLQTKGIETKVIELSASARTAQQAADSLGCSVAQIIKSLIFRRKITGRPILVLASGSNRVDEKLISEIVGEEIGKADADFTREVTGFAIGGIPPIGHKMQIETIIDEDLFKYDVLWAAAGTPHAVFSIASSQVKDLTSGKIARIHL